MEEKVIVERKCVGQDVERLLRACAGARRRGDVADRVAAGAAVGDADVLQAVVDLPHRLERNPVELNVLARGDVQQPAAPALADFGDGVELHRRQHAAGDLHPLHVAGVIELSVEPVREPDGRSAPSAPLPRCPTAHPPIY